jgi:hypothetical protein
VVTSVNPQEPVNFIAGKGVLGRRPGLNIGDRIGLLVMKVNRDVIRRLLKHREVLGCFVDRLSIPCDLFLQSVSDAALAKINGCQEKEKR